MNVPTVFISSTAQDLVAYRAAAREAAERAGFRVIGMESFEGRDERPLAVCQEKVAQADVVVAIVAHRYGWVPPDQPPAPDGSRDRSITWLECEHAKALGKEVLAFVVQDEVEWPPLHMDSQTLVLALTKRAAPEKLVSAQRDVQRLGDFKQWLNEGTTPRFRSPADLDLKIYHALIEWQRRRASAPGHAARLGGAAAVANPRMYLEALAARTGHIDIRGLQVGSGKAYRFPIDELYIPLTIAGGATAEEQRPSSGKTMRPRNDEPGRRARGRHGTPGGTKEVARERPRPIALDEALRRERLVIVGDPGSGKTTYLHRVAHALCQALLGVEADAASRRLGLDDRPFPILVRLADLAEHVMRHRREGGVGVPVGADAGAWLPHFLAARSGGEAWGLDEAYFRAVLEKGPCLALLDGLDEAPDRVARESLSRLVDNLARACPKARMVVTSRPGAYVGATVIPGFAHVQIEPLEPEAVQGFLARWSEAIWPAAPREAARHREELTGALRVPEIARLARNPVMLTALAVVHWNERRLPEQRADLYESIIKWLSRARERRAGRPSAERCVTLLQELALAMHAHPDGRRVQVTLREGAEAIAPELSDGELRDSPERRRVEAAERFLVDEELDSGIVVGRGHELAFWHLTFQEFLAARAVAARSETEQRTVLLAGAGRLYMPEWAEQVQYPSRPIAGVSWYEAAAFCAWAGNKLGWGGCRLPTEAEWERAARGREARKFPWDAEPIDPERANYGGNVGHPTPVGVYPHGRTPEGVDDLAGNVWEWCFDRDGPYEKGRRRNPTGVAKGGTRVMRGGSWFNPDWSPVPPAVASSARSTGSAPSGFAWWWVAAPGLLLMAEPLYSFSA